MFTSIIPHLYRLPWPTPSSSAIPCPWHGTQLLRPCSDAPSSELATPCSVLHCPLAYLPLTAKTCPCHLVFFICRPRSMWFHNRNLHLTGFFFPDTIRIILHKFKSWIWGDYWFVFTPCWHFLETVWWCWRFGATTLWPKPELQLEYHKTEKWEGAAVTQIPQTEISGIQNGAGGFFVYSMLMGCLWTLYLSGIIQYVAFGIFGFFHLA